MTDKKILVAYFSCTGVTRAAAEQLAQAAGADIYEIAPAVPYTAADLNWNNKQSRSSVEMNDPHSRPAIAGGAADMAQYDAVFIGFPVWWYVAPTIINTFIEGCDLSGKVLVPFATSGGSGIANCVKALKSTYPQYDWREGRLLNGSQTPAELSAWVESL